MKTDNRFFDDVAKMATGAVSAFAGARQQIRQEIRSQVTRFMGELDVVPREDFDIVEAMAREALLKIQKLETRLAMLEGKKSPIKTETGKAPKKSVKTAAKKKTPAKKAR